MSQFPQGSEWRRWDPHVHTPESALSNRFTTWDDYINALEAEGQGVSVLGITDYCTIDGYKKVLDYREQGRLQTFDFIFPNIEFRITPDVKGRGINIHLLIDPSDNHISKIERALRDLKFSYNNSPYACSREDLILLSKTHNPSIIDDQSAFRNGVNLFKPSFDAFREWYAEQGWLRANSLIVLANSSGDGASGLARDSGFAALREDMYRFSHLIFSATPNDREYFLGKGCDSSDEVKRKCGSLMPCIHGSDAHENSKLFDPDLQRYCWIKANPTFEGLRQVLHEPEDRVYIGPTPQQPVNQSHIIQSVEFVNAESWFTTEILPLNSGLVGIIGEKGTGKTALAELIAYAAGAEISPDSTSSFIKKAKRHLRGVSLKLNWADGRSSQVNLDDAPSDEIPEVRYLSQDFVEDLCSQDLTGEKLINQIEEVVFSYIDEPDRLDTSSFEELRRITSETLTNQKNKIKSEISSLNREIVELENQISERPEKERLLKNNVANIASIEAQLPELSSSMNPEVADQIEKLTTLLQAKSDQLSNANLRLNRLSTARGKVVEYKQTVAEQFNDLRDILEEVGLSEVEIDVFRPNLPVDAETPITRIEEELREEVMTLRGDPNNLSSDGETIADLESRITHLREALASDQKQRDRLLELQKQKSHLESERQRIVREIERIDTRITSTLNQKIESRWRVYLSYFDVLAEEDKMLYGLYAPLDEAISDDPMKAKKGFELNVKQIVDSDSWIEEGLALFDKRKTIPIYDRSVVQELENSLFDPWADRDKENIKNGLGNLLQRLENAADNIDLLCVSFANRERVYDWLFGTDHVRLEYGLRYQGNDLEVLSPGTRGIVLLVLYLAMDRHDCRPLIIDQPEGNLDSSSIYRSLVPFLRTAKQLRQVILVTHNPNLVVTTDADQVIVTTASRNEGSPHPKITYTCGALDDAGHREAIRTQAVRLLEGGSTPFRVRENRYALSTTNEPEYEEI